MKINLTFLELLLLIVVSLSVYVWARYGARIKRWWKDLHKRRRGARQLRSRSPEDCPACARGYYHLPRRPRHDVIPWSELKSKAGTKKQFDTTGYACTNPACHYYGVTDPTVHALVSNGPRGIRKDIPYLRVSCQFARAN